ncbi:rod shape-determining protein, partial [Planomonospora corallina]
GRGPADLFAFADMLAAEVGCPVTVVEEPLAAAVGCGLDVTDPRPRLLLDVGAGIIEAAVICDGAVVDAGAVQVMAESSADLPEHVHDQVTAVLSELVARVPASRRRGVRERGLLLTGGGVLRPRLARGLCARLGVTVSPAPAPAHATVRGLARLGAMPGLLDLLVARQR